MKCKVTGYCRLALIGQGQREQKKPNDPADPSVVGASGFTRATTEGSEPTIRVF